MIPGFDTDIALRLITAVVVGGLLGLNRELRHKPAGLRTHALVGLGAAVVTSLVAWNTQTDSITHVDATSRVIQGILTGIGFLGAGVILRTQNGQTVHGLTTAASIWMAACIGCACGCGAWMISACAFALVLLVLIYGGPLERWLVVKLGVKARAAVDAPDGAEGKEPD
jgi:putative Mg2+ transporter-C (MgtC) family protein